MKKKLLLFLLIMVVSIVTAACGSSDNKETATKDENENQTQQTEEVASKEMTITHELGETTITTNPETVVVFDMGALDTLDKLGVKVAAVPHDGLPSYLSKYEGTTENAGGLKEPDFEAISELAPDLILISARQAEVYDQLSEIAPTVYVGADTTKYIDSVKTNLTLIGKIFGKEKEVAKLNLQAIDEKINSLKASIPADKKGLVVLASGGKISAFGPASRFGFIHDVFGVPAVDDKLEVSQHGQSISPEYIAEKNPDYLFVIDRDAVVGGGESTAKATVENDIVKNTNAFKEGNIVYLDPNYWYFLVAV